MKKLFISCFVICLTIACSDDAIELSDERILKFKDASEMFDYVNNQDAQNSNFVSFDDVYHEALGKLFEAETEAEHLELLERYKDVIYLEGDTYKPTLSNLLYRRIINRDRMYEAAGFLHRVVDDQFIVVANPENLKELKQIISVDNINSEFKFVKYQEEGLTSSSGKINANCGSNLTAEYFYNQSNCKDDRKAYIRGAATNAVSGYYYTPTLATWGYGERRSGVWCNWGQYQTEIWTQNASYHVSITINGGVQTFPVSYPDKYSNGDVYELIIYQGPVAQPIYWVGGAVPTIQFTQIHAECRTRGTNNNWAVIDCPL